MFIMVTEVFNGNVLNVCIIERRSLIVCDYEIVTPESFVYLG